mgnify:CR=1 FL=1
MTIYWQHHTCLLTGATGGIGKEIAKALAARGVTLLLTGRSQEKLAELHNILPGKHILLCADLNEPAGMEKVVEAARRHQVSMLINNAGCNVTGEFHHMHPATLTTLMNTNLALPMQLTLRLLDQFLALKQAVIVNIGSTFGSIGYPCNSVYCATKFGLRGWTESLQREYAHSPLQVYYLAPRATQTSINSDAMVNMNKALGNQMDAPQVVADALICQLQNNTARRFIGFPEKLFARINGAFPGLVDNALIKQLPTIKRYLATH